MKINNKLQIGDIINISDNTNIKKPSVFDFIKESEYKKQAKENTRQKMLANQPQLSQYDNSTYANYNRKKAKEERDHNRLLLDNQYLWKVDPTRKTANTPEEAKKEFIIQKSLVNATADAAAGELLGAGLVKGVNKLVGLKNIKINPKANPTSRYRNIGNDKKGLINLFTTGKVQPKIGITIKPKIEGTIQLKQKGLNSGQRFKEAFFGTKGEFVDPKEYAGKYFLEADKTIDFIKPYANQWGFTPVKNGIKTDIELSNPGLTIWKRGEILGTPYIKQIPKPTQIANEVPNKIPQILNIIKNTNDYIK